MKENIKSNQIRTSMLMALIFFISLPCFFLEATAKKNGSKMVKSTFETPDFAFPQTVEKDAMPVFRLALDEKDGLKALRAAMQVIVARNLISKTAFNDNVALLDSAATVVNAPYSSLFRLLEATLYSQLYEGSPWVYNQRVLPLDTYPDNPESWSRDLFAKKTLYLINSAFDDVEIAKTLPISTIAAVLVNSEEAEKSGLTVYDFMVYASESLLDEFKEQTGDRVIPFSPEYARKDLSIGGECFEKSEELISDLVAFNEKRGNLKGLALAAIKKADMMDFDARKKYLYEWSVKLEKTPEDARVLVAYSLCLGGDDEETQKDIKEYYKRVVKWLEEFPNAEGAPRLRFNLANIGRESLRLELDNVAIPATSIKGKAHMRNMNRAYILVYRLPESMVDDFSVKTSKFPAGCTKVAAIPVSAEGTIPFSTDTEFEIPGLAPGNYLAIPSATQTLGKNWKKNIELWSVSSFRVSHISLLIVSDSRKKDSAIAYVVDARTQAPVAGASVTVYADDGTRKILSSGTSGADGSFPVPSGYHRIKAKKGASSADFYYGAGYYQRDVKARKMASILTDLAIYRPGDSIQFVLVGWLHGKDSNSLLTNERVKVSLFDANNSVTDTLNLTTDKYGRCDGKFKLPDSGLLGRYRLQANFPGSDDYSAGSASVEVAEYKTPGFVVEVAADSTSSYNVGDTIKFSGTVRTYSGMPLPGADVSYTVRWTPWWRFWHGSNPNASYSGTLQTDGDGKFIVSLPTAGLKGTDFEKGNFSLLVTATSASGETQSASDLHFCLGEGYEVNPGIPDKVEVTSDTLKFNVPVHDMLTLPAIREVEYTVENVATGKIVDEGAFASPTLMIPSSKLPSAQYRFVFNVKGEENKAECKAVIWRNDDEKVPYPTPLWVPRTEIVCESGKEKADIKLGSYYADSYILMTVSNQHGIVHREWINVNSKDTVVSVAAPGSKGQVWVTLIGMHDYERKNVTVSIIPESETRRLDVEATTFRDKISAGDRETWSFRFTVSGKEAADAAAMAVMSDKALNALTPFSWHFRAWRDFYSNSVNVSGFQPGTIGIIGNFSTLPRWKELPEVIPAWQTYGYGLGLNQGNTRMRKSIMIRGIVKAESVVNEMKDDGAVEEVMNTMQLTSAPLYASSAESFATGAVADMAEMEEPASANEGISENRDAELRPVEMPLAFFMPSLHTDDKGNVEVEFVTPDFNTTWQFQILGYTPDLLTASLVKDAVASKQVMVKSNPPRYLRTGDKAEISALVFNNSAEELSVGGELEVFNIETGKTLASEKLEAVTTSPSGSRIVTLIFEVPSDVSQLGLRAYAYGGNHSDGEQTLICVLPSSTPVIESTQFYIGSQNNIFETKLPKFDRDANVTLKYCDNPLWECLLALPSISTPDSENLLTLARALYANATASGIVRENPWVKAGLDSLFSARNDRPDATLTSKLQKDKNLKAVALNNTPWVNNAAAETERMNSLNTLLDTARIANSMKIIMDKIVGLQNADGGWSWCKGMKSSLFMTEETLGLLGMLKADGWLPEQLVSSALKALSYCDKEIYDSYIKSEKKFSTTSMLSYLLTRINFPEARESSGFAKLKKEALKSISEQWKDFGPGLKAQAALLLYKSKGYEKEALLILESLTQYASKSVDKGWWFDNMQSGYGGWSKLINTSVALQAFSAMEPESPAVDGLRQWLVLQKETEDWGANSSTVSVIDALISSGARASSSPSVPEIRIGNQKVELPAGEMLTGVFTVSLDPRSVSGKKLSIVKDGDAPAWGGVISQYVAPIVDVKVEDCENLKVEKQLLVVEPESGGKIANASRIRVGDKVRVTLTLTCDKDMNYVALIDERGAFLEPADQISGYTYVDGLGTYREVRDSKTSFFIEFLPKGVNVITYDCYADRAGIYSTGIATVQSQYSPLQVAHSAGALVKVEE